MRKITSILLPLQAVWSILTLNCGLLLGLKLSMVGLDMAIVLMNIYAFVTITTIAMHMVIVTHLLLEMLLPFMIHKLIFVTKCIITVKTPDIIRFL